jgi:hypothetical protein
VHRLDPPYRDGAALFDEVVLEMLWAAHLRGPVITLSQLPQSGANGEVSRHDVV